MGFLDSDAVQALLPILAGGVGAAAPRAAPLLAGLSGGMSVWQGAKERQKRENALKSAQWDVNDFLSQSEGKIPNSHLRLAQIYNKAGDPTSAMKIASQGLTGYDEESALSPLEDIIRGAGGMNLPEGATVRRKARGGATFEMTGLPHAKATQPDIVIGPSGMVVDKRNLRPGNKIGGWTQPPPDSNLSEDWMRAAADLGLGITTYAEYKALPLPTQQAMSDQIAKNRAQGKAAPGPDPLAPFRPPAMSGKTGATPAIPGRRTLSTDQEVANYFAGR